MNEVSVHGSLLRRLLGGVLLVPSLGKGGGLGVGLATPPRKTHPATETPTKNQQENSALGSEGSSTRIMMTPCSESRKTLEATRPIFPLLSTRATNIGTWNIRTMWETGKAFEVAAEMKNYNLALLGVSEPTWTQSGQKRLASGEMLLYSGHEEDNAPHTQGVALMPKLEWITMGTKASWGAMG